MHEVCGCRLSKPFDDWFLFSNVRCEGVVFFAIIWRVKKKNRYAPGWIASLYGPNPQWLTMGRERSLTLCVCVLCGLCAVYDVDGRHKVYTEVVGEEKNPLLFSICHFATVQKILYWFFVEFINQTHQQWVCTSSLRRHMGNSTLLKDRNRRYTRLRKPKYEKRGNDIITEPSGWKDYILATLEKAQIWHKIHIK